MPLVIDSLTVARGGRIVLEAVSERVAAGEALSLTGPNGAGKTTLLRTIAGFIHPEAGRIVLTRNDDPEPVEAIGESAHWIGHLDGIKGTFTAFENARFSAMYLGGSASAVEPVLDRVGLGELTAVPARFLSAGQRRRLSLARLLLAPRPLWLLDEPTASLDRAGQEMLAALAAEHLRGGGIIVAATHMPLGFANMRELRLGREAGA